MSEQKIIFVLGDVLPTYYDAAISIYSVASKPKTRKMKDTIHGYAKALIDIWQKSFGTDYVISRSNVVNRIEKIIKHYHNNVYNNAYRKTPKHKDDLIKTCSLRRLNKAWRCMKIMYKTEIPIDSLLDIGQNTDNLTGRELIFYNDQKGKRECRLSEEIDDDWVKQQNMLKEQQIEEEQQQILEETYETVEEDCEMFELDKSLNRSGICRVLSYDKNTQTNNAYVPPPCIRNTRDCTYEIKSTCVQVSVNCGISAKMSTIAVQTVCKSLYNHEFYLTRDEAIVKDPALIFYKEAKEKKGYVQSKRQKLMTEKKKPPTSKEDYLSYQKILPSLKTIVDYKQLLAVQAEADAANTLYNIPRDVKCTLHYDTISLCRIDGEWPAIIFSFSNGHRYTLRCLFFAYEDRSQIVRLLVETYKRLTLTVTLKSSDTVVTAKDVWEKTSIIMTDSVEKNLYIEDGIAAVLGSEYKPLHMLCKAHTVKALDRSNIDVLARIEHQLKFRESLESINPGVRSFLLGEMSVVISAIKSILNFVSHDKSATSTNQADLFDYILQRENKVKHLSLYQERRFTKLGYSCSSILDALPYIRMVLDKAHLSNQHVEIVQMFVDSEFILMELSFLSYFTYKVSRPLLYAVEICTQDELCNIFPKLLEDLLHDSLETLSSYIIEYRHVKVQPPSSDVEKEIMLQKLLSDNVGGNMDLVEEKIKKAKNQSQYTNKLLNQCKSWQGPVSSIDELNAILSEKPDMMEQIVRTELTYYKNTHKAEVIASPSLFKLNKISHEERLTNLFVLLGGMNDRSITILPGNKDALAPLKNDDGVAGVAEVVNQICVTLWDDDNGNEWYIGYCKEVRDNGTFLVEHVDSVEKYSNLKWKYPASSDTCVVDAEQECNVKS